MWYVIKEDELYHHGIKGQKWGVRRFQNPDGTLTSEGKKRYGKSSKDEDAYDIANRVLKGKVHIVKRNNATISEGRTKVGGKEVSLDVDLTDDSNGRSLLSNEKALPYLKQVNKLLDRIAKDDSQLREAIARDNYDWVNSDTTVFGENPPTRAQFKKAFEPTFVDVTRFKDKPYMWVVYKDAHDLIGYASADVTIDVNTGDILTTQLDW